ncbi:hypothetical protein BGW39_008809 [Mortierella sp. 14UC]|nr:hypothetical protein BGW39_008809 [Mortierella sp. 14UC]
MSTATNTATLALQIPEILHWILTCRHILDLQDIFSTSLVSRTWYQVSKRAQWIRVELDSDSWVDPYHHALAAQLSRHGHLVRTLVLKECVADRSQLEALLPFMTHLQSIVVGRVTLYNRSSSLLQSLELLSVAHLQHLCLPHVSTTSGRVDLLLRICESQAHKLHHLDLLDSEIDDDILEDIARTCPSLRTLDLSRNEVIAFKGFLNNSNGDSDMDDTLENWTESWLLLEAESSTTLSAALPATIAAATTTAASISASRQWASNQISPYSQRQGVQQHNTIFDTDDTLGVLFSACKQQQTHKHQHKHQHKQQHLYQQNQTLPRRLPHPSKLLQEDPPFLHLEELSLVFCLGIANTEFQTLFRSFRNKSLRSLNLQFTNIEDSGLEALAHSLGHRLTSLSVSYCNRITARGIRALVDPDRCPRLLELEFLSCDLVSADCFRTPDTWGCRRLRRLEFTFHPRVAMARMESERAAAEAEEKRQQELEQDQGQGQSTSEEPMVDGVGTSDSGLVSPHAQVQSQQGQAQQQQQHLEHQHFQQQYQQEQQTPTHTNEQGKQALPLDNRVCFEESQERKEQCRDNQWEEEQDSVRNDYYALFRQLKRLTELRYLNIYNSPALNSTLSSDTCQSSDSPSPSEVLTNNVDDSDSAVPLIDVIPTTSPLQEPWSELAEELNGSSSSSSDDMTMASRREHRRVSIASESEQSSDREMDAENHLSTLHDRQSFVSPSPVTKLSDPDPSQQAVDTTITATPSVSEPTSIHPFSLGMGLKALERLSHLESLTFYERSSITLEAAEVRWIGQRFPHLSLLQLRGAIDVPEEARRQLMSRRPDIHVQVCSLFD